MKQLKIIELLLCLLILTGITVACKKKEETTNLVLPETPVYKDYANYLVSTESYMRLYKEQDIYSEVLTVVRKGDSFILLEARGNDELGDTWFYVNNNRISGWVLLRDPWFAYSSEEANVVGRKLKAEAH